jgi:hypothetical protein
VCLSRVCLRTQLLPAVSSNRYHVRCSYCVTMCVTRYRQYPCPNNLYIGAQPALVPCYPPTRALARTTCS